MTSDAMLTQIACPTCEALSTSDNNYCGYCGVAATASNRHRDYERAVGSSILALNGVESEVFYLLDLLGEATPSLEGAYFAQKIEKLEAVAAKQPDTKIRTKI